MGLSRARGSTLATLRLPARCANSYCSLFPHRGGWLADRTSDTSRLSRPRKAADLLATSEVAVELAKMDRSAAMLNGGEKYFFGQEPRMLENIFMKKSV